MRIPLTDEQRATLMSIPRKPDVPVLRDETILVLQRPKGMRKTKWENLCGLLIDYANRFNRY